MVEERVPGKKDFLGREMIAERAPKKCAKNSGRYPAVRRKYSYPLSCPLLKGAFVYGGNYLSPYSFRLTADKREVWGCSLSYAVA